MRAAHLPLRLAVVLAGITLAGSAWAEQGLQLKSKAFSSWQARLQLSQSLDDVNASYDARRGSRVLSANLLGDYYLTGSGLGRDTRGGLRATGGLMLGPMSLVQSSSGLALGRGSTLTSYFSVGQRGLSLLAAPERENSLPMSSYVGVGYTSYSLRGGWGFSADLGVLANNTPALRLGNSLPQDDTSRDMRFKPVLQFGVSYSF
ncbi:hypothetical protein [Roseateles amylovorans]|uniref:Outer membrane protein beta-barrel domain-containing protein n=1 Tax=Roseateles amylovorans TaxID=2978473 RepID=A0ABY6AX44_9BURK|nr:hypothetical protein [Roseateles amylovorans]UXH77761.1 hypothetical protein N4261_22710 [Roseateles amylovorans]